MHSLYNLLEYVPQELVLNKLIMMNKEEVLEVLYYLEKSNHLTNMYYSFEHLANLIVTSNSASSHNKNPKVIINKKAKEENYCDHCHVLVDEGYWCCTEFARKKGIKVF